MRWPAWGISRRLASKHSLEIRKAFQSVLSGEEIARQWSESHPAGGSVTPQLARDWAHVHITASTKPMQNALAHLYADGWVTGTHAADYVMAHLKGLKKATDTMPVTSGIVDWSTWKPGLPAAAALVKPRGGLESLLASRKITISDDVVYTKLDRIGSALGRALEKGYDSKTTAQMIDAVINDPEQALLIARTEMSRAVSVATRDRYEQAGVEQVEWLVADGCDICQENADASPIGIDETFPSGDSEPPAHPNCECALASYFPDEPSIELSVDADLIKFIAEPSNMAQALVRLAILPNPIKVQNGMNTDKLIEVPWARIEQITVNPDVWSKAKPALVNLKNLTATDPYLRRKKIQKHVEAMGQKTTSSDSLALVIEREGKQVIIDGHHRLMAMWLLGQDTAPVWLAKD